MELLVLGRDVGGAAIDVDGAAAALRGRVVAGEAVLEVA